MASDKDKILGLILKEVIQGSSQDAIAASLGTSQGFISKQLKKIGEYWIGIWGENFERNAAGLPARNVNASGADMELDDKIISIKYRLSGRGMETIYPEKDLKPEIIAAITTGKPLFLLAYHVKFKNRLLIPLDPKKLPRIISVNYEKGNWKLK